MILDVEYNNMLGSAMGVYAKELPDIPTAKRREKEVTIPGRDGTIYTTYGDYESIDITIPFNFICDETEWDKRWGAVKNGCQLVTEDCDSVQIRSISIRCPK